MWGGELHSVGPAMRQTQYPLAPHRTLTTGVHFGFDDGDDFFNPASRTFPALRLAA
jgi:hypothetical protein